MGTGFGGTALEGFTDIAMVGAEGFGPATVGAAAFSAPALALAGGGGALAGAGRIGAATGDPVRYMDGIPGGTTLFGIRRGCHTTITRITQTAGTTIRDPTIRRLRMTTTRLQAI